MKIIFIRHGESEANVQQIISNTGYIHGLTDLGKKQAEILAIKLRESYPKLRKIISSPLKRADETAKIICDQYNSEHSIDDRLMEFNTGILEGKSDSKSWNQLYDLWKLWLSGEGRSQALPGGKSLDIVVKRIEDFLKDTTREYFDDDIIMCVSHGGVIQTALPYVKDIREADKLKSYTLNNTDIVVLDYSKADGFTCSQIGSI